MEITRNVILDLLPLYLADEVSPDTRALVEQYLATDPELAKMAKQPIASGLHDEVPVPLAKEHAMEAYKEAKRLMVLRTLGLAVVIAVVFLCTLAMAVTVAVLFVR